MNTAIWVSLVGVVVFVVLVVVGYLLVHRRVSVPHVVEVFDRAANVFEPPIRVGSRPAGVVELVRQIRSHDPLRYRVTLRRAGDRR